MLQKMQKTRVTWSPSLKAIQYVPLVRVYIITGVLQIMKSFLMLY